MSPEAFAGAIFWRIHFCRGHGFSFVPQASSAKATGAAARVAAPSTTAAIIPQAQRPFIIASFRSFASGEAGAVSDETNEPVNAFNTFGFVRQTLGRPRIVTRDR
jgi:hypothetical protein